MLNIERMEYGVEKLHDLGVKQDEWISSLDIRYMCRLWYFPVSMEYVFMYNQFADCYIDESQQESGNGASEWDAQNQEQKMCEAWIHYHFNTQTVADYEHQSDQLY